MLVQKRRTHIAVSTPSNVQKSYSDNQTGHDRLVNPYLTFVQFSHVAWESFYSAKDNTRRMTCQFSHALQSSVMYFHNLFTFGSVLEQERIRNPLPHRLVIFYIG